MKRILFLAISLVLFLTGVSFGNGWVLKPTAKFETKSKIALKGSEGQGYARITTIIYDEETPDNYIANVILSVYLNKAAYEEGGDPVLVQPTIAKNGVVIGETTHNFFDQYFVAGTYNIMTRAKAFILDSNITVVGFTKSNWTSVQ